MNFVTSTASTFQAFFEKFARPVLYSVSGNQAPGVQVKFFIRGLREDDLFAEAMQQDSVAICDAAAFKLATGVSTPRRLDAVTTALGKFRVEAWRGAPNDGAPTFFKVLLRGGQQ